MEVIAIDLSTADFGTFTAIVSGLKSNSRRLNDELMAVKKELSEHLPPDAIRSHPRHFAARTAAAQAFIELKTATDLYFERFPNEIAALRDRRAAKLAS